MDAEKQKRPEAVGWGTATVAEFLEMCKVDEIALDIAIDAEADYRAVKDQNSKYRPEQTVRLAQRGGIKTTAGKTSRWLCGAMSTQPIFASRTERG